MAAHIQALIFDYGGVLTSPLLGTMDAFVETDGIDPESFRHAMREWLGLSYGTDATDSPVHALERGEVEVPDFERQLAARLTTIDGRPVEAKGLLTRMFAGFGFEPAMAAVLRHAKAAGLRTALLSNSWGLDYPRESWDELFDVIVISGEVGMRKPEARIYQHAADKLGLPPEACVFVDDLAPNIRGAEAVGMVGIHHVTPQQTIEQLEGLLGIDLRASTR
ncbi:MAG TPA: HAD family phosphatase [Mycobacteriales bacterium]|nr:HAD family phosphatase [Mycobacteriales bacterium]